MKIGIVTFHRAHNYGAVLQAYALQSYLQSLRHEVSFVDYRCKQVEKGYKLFYWRRHISKSLSQTVRRNRFFLQRLSARLQRRRAFNRFINNYARFTAVEDAHQLDCCVLGSDQIWNGLYTGGLNDIYWGTFLQDAPIRVISYAASMEAKAIPAPQQEEVKQRLKAIDAIAVREELLKEILQPLTERPITVTIDPTLLVDSSVWDNMALRPSHMPPNYVLLYLVHTSEEVRAYAQQEAEKRGAVLVELEADLREAAREHLYSGESPEEYVAWFKYAACVFTTSFHGTAFSLIFNKEFYIYDPVGMSNTRVQSLLQQLGIAERQLTHDTPPTCSAIDYSTVNQRLDAIRENSRNYLINALKQ